MLKSVGHRSLFVVTRGSAASASVDAPALQTKDCAWSETDRRVTRAVDQIGPGNDWGTPSCGKRKPYVVGLVIPDLVNPLVAELAAGVERGLHQAGTVPLLVATGESQIQQAQAMQTLRQRGISGFVICPTLNTSRAIVCDAKDTRLPMVAMMRHFRGAQASFVGPDNRRGAESATTHLIARGHRRIAFLGGFSGTGIREERLQGYAIAMRAASLGVDQESVVESPPSRDGGLAVLERVLALRHPPTAALCFNDAVALGVLSGLARHGMTAGPEFGVIGFGGLQDAQFAIPPLTTVAIDAMSLGERAAEVLVERIDDPRVGPVEHRGLTRLVVRASCGHAQGRFSA